MKRAGRGACGALLALAAALLLGGCQGAAEPALGGRIAWPRDGDLWALELPGKQSRKLIGLPTGEAVTGVAWWWTPAAGHRARSSTKAATAGSTGPAERAG